MKKQTQAATTELILDGENFFGTLFDALDAVEHSEPAPNTYVRLAFWQVEHDLLLIRHPEEITLEEKLKAVADAGHHVQLIMWCPAQLDIHFQKKGLSQGIYNTNLATANALGGYRGRDDSGGSIEVLMEIYNGWNGSSVHQKLVLWSIEGLLTAMVGGMNLASFYWDTENHEGRHKGGMGGAPLGRTVHDSALRLDGPAAVVVEEEWLRRWRKRYYKTQLLNNRGTGTTPVADPKDYESQPKARLEDQPPGYEDVVIATTSSESYGGRAADIQSLLVEQIRAARRYIYFENYIFSDPTLVEALATRLRGPRPPIVIIMVPMPYEENPYPFDYLNYISFAKLALASCDAVTAKGRTVERERCSKWGVSESMNAWSTLRSMTSTVTNRWLETDAFSCQPQNGAELTCPLLQLQGFRGGIRFYAPVRRPSMNSARTAIYIHSKLALFDDSVAVVGSANFSYRSMVYDGELSAFVHGDGARRIRETLFRHYNMNTPEDWDDDAVGDLTDLPLWETGVLRLELEDFDRRVPSDKSPEYKWGNHTFF
ncbi:phosphatidylserine/phosphatidylglycerophosphate/cardiolipin synthase family protein [Myxococcus sp. AB025B]|uniref:phospholipase D-like domain-containing protein n=1 Tax=Myxococcus sp. AB025B TaxID=2562794 RepID=UPI0011444246|nr:phospholipase D-like domain-containing protein [Myxococcus sp. AB025B]